MSKKNVEQEAFRLAKALEGKPTLGDRVVVMVVRANLENLTDDIGVASVDMWSDKVPLTKEATVRKGLKRKPTPKPKARKRGKP